MAKALNPKKPLDQPNKAKLYRLLFTLGLLSKHFDVESAEFVEYKMCTRQQIFELFLYFIRQFDIEIQQRALVGLGSFLSRHSEFMMKAEVKALYLNYMHNSSTPVTLKSQVFLNLTDYLTEEDQKNLTESVQLSKNMCFEQDNLKEMRDVQAGMASSIIQLYLKPILESYLTSNSNLRTIIFNCLSLVLTQGLVYPVDCVPYLIAMTTDTEKKIQTKALAHLTNLFKAHPGFVQSKSIAGVRLSFHLQKVINKPPVAQQQPSEDSYAGVIRGFSELTEILSLNHHLYSLLRGNRSYRRAFSQQLLKMFDDSSVTHQSSLAQMLYISDNLAYFPYQLMDEPLYLIHQIDMIISVTGISLLQTFKEVNGKKSLNYF